MDKTVLFLLPDCPGYFVRWVYEMARRLVAEDVKVVFVSTTPYYEHFKQIRLGELGDVHYFADFLEKPFDEAALAEVEVDLWWVYPTFVRQSFFRGRHQNDWAIYKKVVLFFRELIERYDFDLAITEPPSNSFLCTAYHLLQRAGVPYFGYLSARIPEHANVLLDEYGERMLENRTAASQETVEGGPPDYMQDQAIKLAEEGALGKLWRLVTARAPRSLETGRTATIQLLAYRKRIWRTWRYRRALAAGVFQRDVDFDSRLAVLFPLQFRPESSTSVLARYFEDDVEVIRNIAFSLPAGARLVVKEHKAAVGIRDLAFYRRILEFPGVELLHPDYPLVPNLGRFDAVVVLTSTVGFEALQHGVPVIILGRVFFWDYPGAIRVDSYDALFERLRGLEKRAAKPDPSVLERYRRYCFPGRFNYLNPGVVQPENIENLMVPVWQLLRGSAPDSG